MKHMVVRLIAILFFAMTAKVSTAGIDTNNYFKLIGDVHRYYHTSCIIFVQSASYQSKYQTSAFRSSYTLNKNS